MAVTHATSAAAVWQVGCLVAVTEGHPPSAYVVIVGTALCAFGAVLPDIDMPASGEGEDARPGSIVAQSLGPVTQAVAFVTARVSARLHAYTRAPADRPNENGHRGLTHTLVFCLAVLLVFGALGRYGGVWAPMAVTFWAAATGLRAMLGRRRILLGRVLSAAGKRAAGRSSTARLFGLRDTAKFWRSWSRWMKRLAWLFGWVRIPVAPAGAAVVVAVMWVWPAPSGWWLGYAVGVGCLAHCLGDAMTRSGVPLVWPWPVQGQVWFPVRPRPEWRFTTGGRKREEVAGSGTVKVVSEDRVEEYVLGLSTVVGVVSGVSVAALIWWPMVLSWTASVQGWWPKG